MKKTLTCIKREYHKFFFTDEHGTILIWKTSSEKADKSINVNSTIEASFNKSASQIRVYKGEHKEVSEISNVRF